ncbi:MAG: hypothetical protein JWO73_794, partial [Candidatus Taylorbacteria bacterium]|nr:hypothetical protein [Candidatus Taylorbacteria bacterium]
MNYVTKKNIVLIVIAALFVTGVFFITEYRNKNAEQAIYLSKSADIIATSTVMSEEEIAANNVDSDGDGLHDWEEVLWSTDPKNPDSDGDGTPDGAEVAAGRNPLVKKTKSADDSFAALARKASASSSKETLTITDEFGRDFFSKYMELRQSGKAKDKDAQAGVIDELLSSSKYNVAPRTYNDNDLILKNNSDKDSLQLYSDQIGTIFKKNTVSSRN